MKRIINITLSTFVLIYLTACATGFTEFSSSTSSTSDAITPDITVNEFVNKRYAAIRHDAANGGGENLDALAELLGKEDKKHFAQNMQLNFDKIFFNVKQPSDILSRLEPDTNLSKG